MLQRAQSTSTYIGVKSLLRSRELLSGKYDQLGNPYCCILICSLSRSQGYFNSDWPSMKSIMTFASDLGFIATTFIIHINPWLLLPIITQLTLEIFDMKQTTRELQSCAVTNSPVYTPHYKLTVLHYTALHTAQYGAGGNGLTDWKSTNILSQHF